MRLERSGIAVAATLMLVLGACGNKESGATRVDATYEALAGQFRACASTAAACLKAADCDEAQNQVCRDQFATCRDAAKAAAEAFHMAVHECRADARSCWGDAGSSDDAGAARHACFDELKMCVASNKPERAPAPPCIAALRDCIQADDTEPRACMMTAHQCFLDSMPPRCDGDGGVIDGGAFEHHGDRGGPGTIGGGDHHAGQGHDDGQGQGGPGRGDHDGPKGSSTDAGTPAGSGP